MLDLLWLIPALPLAGFCLLVLGGNRIRPRGADLIGAGSVGLSALVSAAVAAAFLRSPPPDNSFTQTLWSWIHAGTFQTAIAFHLDALSLVMTLTVTGVAFLIHLYSTAFMAADVKRRFFAYMNLFTAAMTILVLANDLLLLYLGWEGVGLCSYLLIGFWYRDEANGRAARKAFLTTRVGDVALAVALFLIFQQFGSLQFQQVFARASLEWAPGSTIAIAVAALILGGAVGKSAQLPLQTWLPDAMAGPTPTSALIHAATMVTAGVYLIARTHALFLLAPQVQFAVALVGAATLLLAGCSALAQNDIKRILAYSTMSQIGYMFLALGAGAWTAAIFHLVTHAFFKALLFLAAGIVIRALDDEHDIFHMGGLRRGLPLAFASFLIGGSALAGLPLVTAGFYSKDQILWETAASPQGGLWLWSAGVLGAFLTSLYIYRLIFIVFFGERRTAPGRGSGRAMWISCGTLCGLSVAGGFLNVPASLGGTARLSALLASVFPEPAPRSLPGLTEGGASFIAAVVYFAGLWVAYVLFLRQRERAWRFPARQFGRGTYRLWRSGWGFDWLYDHLLVRPLLFCAHIDRNDFFDRFFEGIGAGTQTVYGWLRLTQTGRLRWYAALIAAGVVVLLAVGFGT